MKKIAISLIRWYQEKISKQTNPKCRHSPTCSSYGLTAYKRFNFFYASLLTLKRYLTCNPLFKPKYDPVPEKVFSLKDDFLVGVLSHVLWHENQHKAKQKLDISFTSIPDFLSLTPFLDQIEGRFVILCFKRKDLNSLEIEIKEGITYYRIDELPLEKIYDVINYETDDKGVYTKNRSFKKY